MCQPYIESATVLSDICLYIMFVDQKKIVTPHTHARAEGVM